MSDWVDLHIHSNKSSDGDFSPLHLIRLARESGFKAISISDHDTTAAYPDAVDLSRDSGVEVIPSIELTTLFDSREFHLLLPFVNWESPVVRSIMTRVRETRFQEAKERIQKLQALGFDISWEEVLKKTKSTPPLGVTIAQILLDKMRKNSHPEMKKYLKGDNRPFAPYLFYKDYFMEGKPAFVPKRHIRLIEVLKLAPQTEGVPVLAHPGAYFEQATREDLKFLKEQGLRGVEVYSSYHTPEQVKIYRETAQELDLVATAGSDFHGRIKPHIHFGFIKDGKYEIVEDLRKRRG
ncbi:MAG: PHP domain-containing protein [Candidatus Aminicenantales bacterium]